jgi:trigger factor
VELADTLDLGSSAERHGGSSPSYRTRRGIMKVTVTSSKGLHSDLKIIVDAKEIEKKIESRLVELKDKINLKGFRPGKAPIVLLKKQFGASVYGEVAEKVLQESTFEALKEKKITPASQPKIEIQTSGEGKNLEFTISVEQVPEIKKLEIEKISLTKYEVKPEKKEVDDRIKNLAEANKKYVEKKEKSSNEDLIIFDFEATVEGKSFEGNKGEKLQIILGKDLFIPGFDSQLVGIGKGEEKIVKVNLPENYPNKDLAGKPSEFKCKIIEVKKPESQKIDDDFAKNFGAKDLKDLEGMVEKQIAKEFESITEQLLKKDILDDLDKKFDFELPKALLDEEIHNVEHALIHEKMDELKAKGEKFSHDHDHDKIKLSESDKKSALTIAKRRVKLALLLNKTGEENNIKVTAEELKVELEKQLRNYPGQEKNIREFYQKNPAELMKLRGPVFEDKVIELITGKAKITKKVLSKEELLKIFNAADQDGRKDQEDEKITKKTTTKTKTTSKK